MLKVENLSKNFRNFKLENFNENIENSPIDVKNDIGFVYDTLDFYDHLKVKDFKDA